MNNNKAVSEHIKRELETLIGSIGEAKDKIRGYSLFVTVSNNDVLSRRHFLKSWLTPSDAADAVGFIADMEQSLSENCSFINTFAEEKGAVVEYDTSEDVRCSLDSLLSEAFDSVKEMKSGAGISGYVLIIASEKGSGDELSVKISGSAEIDVLSALRMILMLLDHSPEIRKSFRFKENMTAEDLLKKLDENDRKKEDVCIEER